MSLKVLKSFGKLLLIGDSTRTWSGMASKVLQFSGLKTVHNGTSVARQSSCPISPPYSSDPHIHPPFCKTNIKHVVVCVCCLGYRTECVYIYTCVRPSVSEMFCFGNNDALHFYNNFGLRRVKKAFHLCICCLNYFSLSLGCIKGNVYCSKGKDLLCKKTVEFVH